MDVKLFIGVLLALMSFVVGPHGFPTEEEVEALLTEIQQTQDTEDVQSPARVAQELNGNRGMWLTLLIKCHFVNQDRSAQALHRQACQYLRAHDCQVAKEVMTSNDLENDEEVKDWLLGVRELYRSTSDKIEWESNSDKVTICLPHLAQKQEPRPHDHSSNANQQTAFYTITFFTSDISQMEGKVPKLLESIAGIAQKQEEKTVKKFEKELGKKIGKKQKQSPYILRSCLKVELEHMSANYKKTIDKMTSTMVEKAYHNTPGMASTVESTHRQFEAREMAQAIAASVAKFKEEELLPVVERAGYAVTPSKGKSSLFKESQEIVDDITKYFRNAVARKFLQTVPQTPEILNDEVVIQDVTVTPDVRYLCNSITRQLKRRYSEK